MEDKNLDTSQAENQPEEKEQTPLLSENPIVLAQKEKMADYLNKHSRQVFVIMLILIAISIAISIYMSLNRKYQDFRPSEVKTNFQNSTGQEIQQFNNLKNDYNRLKAKEKRVDSLIDRIEKKKSETYNLEE